MKLKIKKLRGKYVKKELESYGRKYKKQKVLWAVKKQVLFKMFIYWVLLMLMERQSPLWVVAEGERQYRDELFHGWKFKPFRALSRGTQYAKEQVSLTQIESWSHPELPLPKSKTFHFCVHHTLMWSLPHWRQGSLMLMNRAPRLLEYPLMNTRKTQLLATTITITNWFLLNLLSTIYNIILVKISFQWLGIFSHLKHD